MNYRSMDHLARLPKEKKWKISVHDVRRFFSTLVDTNVECLFGKQMFFFVSLVWLFKTHERFTTLFACTKRKEGKKQRATSISNGARAKTINGKSFYTETSSI